LPFPHLRAGTDSLPQIESIVVLMLENHSFDNILGMLGRGDGFKLGKGGLPQATNPDGKDKLVHAFHMPTPCQLPHQPSQTWNASHRQYDGGKMDGFVESASGPVAMGYWTSHDLPFTYGLARTFPICDRYFCSVLAQTFPNRRFLISGTAYGIVDDTVNGAVPPNGTIFTTLHKYGIAWKNYYSNLPTSYLYPSLITNADTGSVVTIDQFFADAAKGTLPGFSLIDPNFESNSEENPQDIQFGEVFLARVVTALMSGPKWSKTLFVWTYDEHGGYYDHVPPPRAVPPDDIPPAITVPPDLPGGYNRYGFRVPAGVVSPNAKPNYVSHVVHDHASILKLVETKWNLPALTRRDANANDLLDMVDFTAKPRFSEPPPLPAPANPASRASCQTSGAGTIPPRGSVVAA
jgi:phospholipase C